MGEIVNLRRARKARERLAADAVAAENRALHGRTRAQRTAEAADSARAERQLDAHRREE